ncbi:MAG: biopolymer transporter ExbD [Prosthecobacter sp.]|nr:biopolymer transporter ExbD [Prosthecobacter sp.]
MKRASQRHLPVYVSQISVTALLDLVLVLLLVFVVVVPFLRREKMDIASDRLRPVEEKAQPPTHLIKLAIQPDQSILLNGKAVSGELLLPTLTELIGKKPETGVLVQMPDNFAAGALARLMDEMHRAGVKQTSVEVIETDKTH